MGFCGEPFKKATFVGTKICVRTIIRHYPDGWSLDEDQRKAQIAGGLQADKEVLLSVDVIETKEDKPKAHNTALEKILSFRDYFLAEKTEFVDMLHDADGHLRLFGGSIKLHRETVLYFMRMIENSLKQDDNDVA